jgi:hypothetical protein
MLRAIAPSTGYGQGAFIAAMPGMHRENPHVAVQATADECEAPA